jgi:phosphate transport system substrate-binding protein
MAVESLQEHEHTIGYLPLANVKGTQLRILKLDGVYPSAINIQQGRYKLAMPLALVYKNEPEGLVKVFIDFIFSKQGQKIISDFGAIPVDRLLP